MFMPEGQDGTMAKGMKNVPGANECRYDGYADGKDHPFDHDRNRECKDKGNHDYLLVLTDHFFRTYSSTLLVP